MAADVTLYKECPNYSAVENKARATRSSMLGTLIVGLLLAGVLIYLILS